MTDLSTLVGFGAGGGGGGGATVDRLCDSTPVDSKLIDRTGGDDRKPYSYTSGLFPGASPNGNIKSRNVFATWAQWRDESNNHTGFAISSFSVDRSTGAITILQGGPQDVWVNQSGAALSTTYLVHDAVHGCFFSGGHNAYPGHSGHQFGYTAGQVDVNGALSGGTVNQSGGDHGYNGTFCSGLNQGTGTQYFMSGGYTSSLAGHRVHQANANGITIGGWSQDGSWTSSSHSYDHIYQPDQVVPSGEAESMQGTSFNSPHYGFNVMRSGSVTQQNSNYGYSYGQAYTGAGGTTFLVQSSRFYGTVGNGSNSKVTLVDGVRDFGYHTITSDPNSEYGCLTIGIGANKFLFFRPNSSRLPAEACELIGIEANQNPKKLAHLQYGDTVDQSILDSTAPDAFYYPVWETDNDTYPKWLVRSATSEKREAEVRVYEITADFSQYTI